MIYKLLISVFLVSIAGVDQINGQYCVPLPVENITISHNAVLSWQPNANETCVISSYLVYIDSGPNTEYIYVVSTTTLNINFLPVCDNYIFRIVAVSTDNLEGQEIRISTKIPLPANANLTVAFLKVTQQEGESVLLEWNLEPEWERCPDRYRVVIDDQDLDYLQDIYTYSNYLEIPNLAACTSYEFGVIAIYNWEIEGPITVVTYNSPPLPVIPPRLTNIGLGNTYVNLTWSLEPFPWNKCAITGAYLEVRDVTRQFNLTVPILDQPERAPLTINLPNLVRDNLYFVNLTIINIAGPSYPVVVAVQTRP